MEVAKISSKGQITIPISVRNKLKLRAGDKIVILEENGRFYFENSAMLAFKRASLQYWFQKKMNVMWMKSAKRLNPAWRLYMWSEWKK